MPKRLRAAKNKPAVNAGPLLEKLQKFFEDIVPAEMPASRTLSFPKRREYLSAEEDVDFRQYLELIGLSLKNDSEVRICSPIRKFQF